MARIMMPKPVTVDFETMGIEGRPDYPPVPVGVSIKQWGKKPRYWAWGHIHGGNNCTKKDAERALKAIWKHKDGLLFQNAKFDVDVAEVHFGLRIPTWDKIHDTMFLIYLEDPRLMSFGLKECAEHFLDWAPEERDSVKDWLLDKEHKKWVESHLGIDPKTGKQETVKPSNFGKFIAYAPGDVVGPYANGDTDRTEALFKFLWKRVCLERAMAEAYEREQRLMPHLLESERSGMRLDQSRLERDVKKYDKTMHGIDEYLRRRTKRPSLNVDSSQELGNALVDAGMADPDEMGYTKTGLIQTNKDAIARGVTDPVARGLLAYRGPLSTCLKTFMRPWLATAQSSGGLLFTNWNQVKHTESGSRVGTSTGRLSSTPNFQNIPKMFEELIKLLGFLASTDKPTTRQVAAAQKKLARLKTTLKLPFHLPELPRVRSYVIPYEKDHAIIDRDFSQQEIRILAHYEDGPLKEAYLANLWMDMHEQTRQMIFELIGKLFDRKPVKNTNFGIIYGQGAPSLSIKNKMTVQESRDLIKAVLAVFPGVKDIMDDMKQRAKDDEPIRTWGGREYYCEEPKWVEKFRRVMSFDYKLINLLIQGSAADATKEAAIRWCEAKHEDTRFYMNVHDQLTGSTPKKLMRSEMEVMRVTMEGLEFDVPLLSEGEYSTENWGELRQYDKAGKITYRGK